MPDSKINTNYWLSSLYWVVLVVRAGTRLYFTRGVELVTPPLSLKYVLCIWLVDQMFIFIIYENQVNIQPCTDAGILILILPSYV